MLHLRRVSVLTAQVARIRRVKQSVALAKSNSISSLISLIHKDASKKFSQDNANRWNRRTNLVLFGSFSIALISAYILQHNVLSPSSPDYFSSVFLAHTIVAKEALSPTLSLLTLRCRDFSSWNHSQKDLYRTLLSRSWERGTWSMEVKQPMLQIARSYTPLPPIDDSEPTEEEPCIRLLVRKEPFGEVSGYIHSLLSNQTLCVRGPHLEFTIPKDVNDVVFVAGGTGIAAVLQVAYTLCEARRNDNVKLHILWASRVRGDCEGGISDTRSCKKSRALRDWFWGREMVSSPSDHEETGSRAGTVVQMLSTLKKKYPNQISVDYYVDREGSFIQEDEIRAAMNSAHGANKLFLVSGPDGFISYLAGPKKWTNGNEVQGPVGGLLGRINAADWAVWKL